MSSHRITAASRLLSDRIARAARALTPDQIRQALPAGDREIVEIEPRIAITHLSTRAVTSGNRAAIHAGLGVFPVDAPTEEYMGVPVLLTWIFHNADDLVGRPDDLVLELDRIQPIED